MKKLLSLCCVLLLAGCSTTQSEEKTTVCKLSEDGMEITNTLVYKGDEVIKQTIDSAVTVEGADTETLTAFVDEYAKLYDDIKGTQYSYDLKDNVLTENIIIEYSSENIEDLLEMGIISSEDENIRFVSYKQTIDLLKESGFTCK